MRIGDDKAQQRREDHRGSAEVWDQEERRRVPDPSLLAVKLEALQRDLVDVKTAVTGLTQAITRLALIEERQSQGHQALDRAYETLTKMESRIQSIEQKLPLLTAQSDVTVKWMAHAITALIAALGMYIAREVGLIT
jgi:hypothetical protein